MKTQKEVGKHTPGPLEVFYQPVNPEENGFTINIGSLRIATMDLDLRSADAEKYADLFAAAPELLAALKNLVDRDLIKDPDNDHMDEVMEVIAKAEGRE
jgi:hypothetical protein